MAEAAGNGLRHVALLYRGSAEYLAAVRDFVQGGIESGEPMWLAPAPRPWLRWLRDLASPLAVVADITDVGRNPARIIATVSAFADAHPGRRIRCLDEPAWPGRSAPELQETVRHEALANLAFAGAPATLLCGYDTAALPPAVIDRARRTHPVIVANGEEQDSPDYLGPARIPPGCDEPLPEPPRKAQRLWYAKDLRPVRALVGTAAARYGLLPERVADLVLAASELAANTLRHTNDGGTIAVWRGAREILCQVRDSGHIADPLAGTRPPANDRAGGHGLWLVNRVCDLVQVRTGRSGTSICLRMRLPGAGLGQRLNNTAV